MERPPLLRLPPESLEEIDLHETSFRGCLFFVGAKADLWEVAECYLNRSDVPRKLEFLVHHCRFRALKTGIGYRCTIKQPFLGTSLGFMGHPLIQIDSDCIMSLTEVGLVG